MTEPTVYIVVLNYNGRDLTFQCLNSLQQLHYGNHTILLVDNGSSDGSVEAISSAFPAVQVVALPENLGYARGNNTGLEIALEHDPDWVMFLNNDTEVDPDLLAAFMEAAERVPEGGILGPKIYYGGEEQLLWYAGGEICLPLGRTRHRGIREHDHGQYDEPDRTDFISGCCLLIRGELVRQLGGFDPAYPMYNEDADLCYRARQLGVDSYYVPAARVWHYVSSSVGGELSLRKVWLKWQSSMRFFRRYARPWYWITILGYQALYYGILGPAKYIRRRWLSR